MMAPPAVATKSPPAVATKSPLAWTLAPRRSMLLRAAKRTLSALRVATRSTLVCVPVLLPLGPAISRALVCVVVRKMTSRALKAMWLDGPRPWTTPPALSSVCCAATVIALPARVPVFTTFWPVIVSLPSPASASPVARMVPVLLRSPGLRTLTFAPAISAPVGVRSPATGRRR
ncbi:hypothetical protein D5038_19845 [Verminephrobacter aporrectodeae subsp. tuberculatae]|nr:hypothetical protein [Verminephrobacter aporrectodeae subsp. tuberculatae]